MTASRQPRKNRYLLTVASEGFCVIERDRDSLAFFGRAAQKREMSPVGPDMKLTHLLHLGAQLHEDPSPPAVKAVLRRAQAVGCCPANLYLSALRLWSREFPLPPDPRVLFPLEDEVIPGHRGRDLARLHV